MAVKFLSFLGTGEYKTVKYEYITDDFKYIDENEVKFVQFSTYNLIKKKLAESGDSSNIKSFIFLTEQARNRNYEVYNCTYDKGLEPLGFYKDELNISDVSICDGKDETEIWKNFSIILDYIDENDRIYVDITHSFRSIPIMFMSLLNYAKSTKNIAVEGIYYGAYESRNTETNIAPIFNLTTFQDIIDWSKAADMMLKKGGTLELYNLSKGIISELNKNSETRNNLTRSLKKLTKELNNFFEALNYSDVRNTCFEVTEVKKTLEDVEMFFNEGLQLNSYKIKPFITLLSNVGQITKNFMKLNDNEIRCFNELVEEKNIDLYKKIIINTNAMIDLCIEFQLYQQAITLLQENCISIITFEMGKNIFNEYDRETARDYILYINKSNNERTYKNPEELEGFYTNNYNNFHEDISTIFQKTNDLRNRVNHASFNLKNNSNIFEGKDRIKNSYEIIKDVFKDY